MKAGDLVVCNCASDMWYKGMIGTIVGFVYRGKDPLVMWPNGAVLCMASLALEAVSEGG